MFSCMESAFRIPKCNNLSIVQLLGYTTSERKREREKERERKSKERGREKERKRERRNDKKIYRSQI